MIVARNWKDIEPKDNPHKVDARDMYHDENAMIVHLQMQPGEALIPHKTPVDVVFYVLEGSGTVEIGDDKLKVTKGTLVESPKNIPHCWHNTGNKKLRIMVIKVPSPIKSTVLL